MNRIIFSLLLCGAASVYAAAPSGGIDAGMLERLRSSYQNTASDKAISNALKSTDIDVLATNGENKNNFDDNFTHRVKSKGITNQKSSGRCWLFTGLNTLRSQMMEEHNLPSLELSQNYNFFYDLLEKSNLFLQEIINTADRPMDDKKVEFLFKNPVSDGGQFTGLSDNLLKYGVVPKSVMVETHSSSATSKLRKHLSTKLREDGVALRRMKSSGASKAALEKEKEHMLTEVYRMLALTLGVPPTEFTWTRKDKDGKVVSTKKYTPQSFYQEYAGNNLKDDYVMLMNDPTREYYKLYEIDLDRHVYDGKNWTYINLPVEDIKKMAIESIKDGRMMYFSCDVGKFIDREKATLDT
ncbi:MAG: aminopeptidase, partial [Muribaculaceae bacterium]|nr:aminopeptidase [Muribaculaceae bacterium]